MTKHTDDKAPSALKKGERSHAAKLTMGQGAPPTPQAEEPAAEPKTETTDVEEA